jgi:PIN domain nuclease of toxin-antitoxin system
VSFLLDTHVFLWLYAGRPAPHFDRAVLEGADATTYVSVVSAFEASTKYRLGKLDEAASALASWDSSVARFGALHLPLVVRASLDAGSLDWAHGDPFDRLLVAQAMVDDLTIVTADKAILGFAGVRTLAW